MPGSPRTDDDSAATGESQADAARPVDFEPNRDAGPGKGGSASAPDAAEAAGTKRRSGAPDKPKADPGAVSPADLTTESDDGAA